MQYTPPKNSNYCATVVRLSRFIQLDNCDNVKAAIIFGNSVIVSKDSQEGALGLFFPVETALSREFLGANNLFRKAEWGNVDPSKTGYFEEHGRVKATKFRGHKSEGFWIPLESLRFLGDPSDLPEGAEFDTLDDHSICRKYVAKSTHRFGGRSNAPKTKDRLIEGQFAFHYETSNLRKACDRILPTDWVTITDKWHGTSAVFANVLVTRPLRWWERLLQAFHIPVGTQEYAFVWSSRKVVKGVGVPRKTGEGFHGNIWDAVAVEVRECVPKGFTLYGEIVGYDDNGKQIQKDYTYGCAPGTHRFLVYRITFTNVDGFVVELPFSQVQQFCEKYGLESVKLLWEGTAESLYAGKARQASTTAELFLKEVESLFVQDKSCPHNDNKVPAEGVVVRIDRLQTSEAYKCKNFAFLQRETTLLDKGEVDTETEESQDSL